MRWAGFIVLCLMVAVGSVAHNDCQRNCGDVSIPYPFGLTSKCILNEMFMLSCNQTFSPPQLFLDSRRVLNISLEGQITVLFLVVSGGRLLKASITIELKRGYRLSDTNNNFVAIGCDTRASIRYNKNSTSTCTSSLVSSSSFRGIIDDNGSCTGNGCCQTVVPYPIFYVYVELTTPGNKSCLDTYPSSYGFFSGKNWYNFSQSDLSNFTQRMEYKVGNTTFMPVTLDWYVESNYSCSEMQKHHSANYACGLNTNCNDTLFNQTSADRYGGYNCHSKQGYQGNPYDLQHGCQDIDECALDPCVHTCSNTEGSYTCKCPFGKRGDGKREGEGCKVDTRLLGLGIGLALLFLGLGCSWLCWTLHKTRLDKIRKKFFDQNGGVLLLQKLSAQNSSLEKTKIFTSRELKAATDNYNESRILGRGGYGVVYKGILSDGRTVAIKKSRMVDPQQTEQFINEVLILSQINHRNVVKLLGCCLETENPLLVYEFINNGTLFHHINDDECKYSISWSNRLRMAAETAGALAYLHSSASKPIIHRDIKSANILLDEHYTAKVADFGASKLIPLDITQLSTLVQGTMGYLDPEYMQTSLLTAKSDVYSFGVVLVELLTGRKALCLDKPQEERNVAMFFVSSLKENRLFQVLEHRVASEGCSDQLKEVANLASRCLRLVGEERPTMKEVAMVLEGLRISEKQGWIEQNVETNAYLQGDSLGYQYGNSGYDSVSNELTNSLHIGR